MNRLHRWLCKSDWWRKAVQEGVPWVLSGTSLGQDVLELGPGPGLTTELLYPAVRHLTVIEIEPKSAQSLRSRLRGTNVEVITGDATSMPFEDARFSACVAFTMLHHVPSAELQNRLFREVCRVLQPGGAFVGSDSLQGLLMRVIHIGDTLVPVDPETLAARLEAAGFEAVRIERDSHAFRFFARRPLRADER